MTGTRRAFHAEWLRLRAGRAILALPLAAGVGALYAAGLSVAADQKLLGGPSGFWVASSAISGCAVLGAALAALFAASTLAHDASSGLLRTALTRPLSRRSWVLGRLGALGLAAILAALCSAAGALAIAGLRYGFLPAAEGEYVLASRRFLTGQLAVGLGVSILAQLGALSLGGALGLFFGATGPAVAAVALGSAASLALGRWSSIERFLPTASLSQGLDRAARLSLGLAGPAASEGLVLALVSAAAWLVAGLAAASYALERKDITS